MNVSFCSSVNTGVSLWKSRLENVIHIIYLYCYRSSQPVLFILLQSLVRWQVSGHTATVLHFFSFQNLPKTAHSAFVYFTSSFFSKRFIRVQVVQSYLSTNIVKAGTNTYFISKWSISYKYRCLLCNGYRRRKWTRRHEFKSWTRLFALHIPLMPLVKVWIQLFSLQLWVNSRADWVLQTWFGN